MYIQKKMSNTVSMSALLFDESDRDTDPAK